MIILKDLKKEQTENTKKRDKELGRIAEMIQVSFESHTQNMIFVFKYCVLRMDVTPKKYLTQFLKYWFLITNGSM